jgi:hypothetical protein
MERTELMEEMAMMRRVFQQHLQLQAPLVLKVNEAKKEVTVSQDRAVRQVQLELRAQRVQMDQRGQQDLQVADQLERKVRPVQMERMEPMAAQAVQD